MSNRYIDGAHAIVSTLSPKGNRWEKIPGAQRFTFGYPSQAFMHKGSGLFAISAVEVASDEDGINRGFEYHISISKPVAPGITERCSSTEAKWVLDQFALDGAEEDNHVPHGKVRNFWRTVATPLIGLECECKAEEPAIREDKGDFVWRA